jgi:hypothetical protein
MLKRHPSEFDRGFSRPFRQDKLDRVINNVDNLLVEHNTLDPDMRAWLTADLRDQRVVRAEHNSAES